MKSVKDILTKTKADFEESATRKKNLEIVKKLLFLFFSELNSHFQITRLTEYIRWPISGKSFGVPVNHQKNPQDE